MGKDYVYVRQNGYSITQAYEKLKGAKVVEASNKGYFAFPPKPYEIQEIELGQGETTESIIRLKNSE